MGRLRTLWKKDPGLAVSGGVHVAGLVFLIVNFAHPPKMDEAIETVPVEMITTSDLNEIMNGEKTAKQMPTPQRRADRIADLEDHKDKPPTPDAKKDTPPEPSPDKIVADPGQAEKPPEPAAEAKPPEPAAAAKADPTPPPPPAPPVPVVPPPPEPPVEKADAKPEPPAPTPPTPPERPEEKAEATPPKDEVKPPPPDAEPIAPAPPKEEAPKPVPKPPKRAKVKPAPKPHPVKLAKVEPTPPPPPPPPRPEPKAEPKLKLFDKVASLLDRMKPDKPLDKVASLLDKLKPDPVKPEPPRPEPKPLPPKPVERQRAGNEVKEATRHDDFNPDKIAAMLSHEAPQRKESTGRSLAQVASLGAPNAHSQKLSPSMAAQLDGWLIDHYRGCWSYFGLGATADYVPTVRIHMAQDGSLIGEPSLVNPPRDPNMKSLADSAIRAVNKCNPLEIPDRFKPYYDQGYRQRLVKFDPKEMS